MKIEITRRVGGHDAGTTLDLPESQANHLIANGYAIEAKSAKDDGGAKTEAKSATVKRRTKPKVDSARTARKAGRDGASDTAEGA